MKYENWYHQKNPFKWISNRNTHTHKEKTKCEEKNLIRQKKVLLLLLRRFSRVRLYATP